MPTTDQKSEVKPDRALPGQELSCSAALMPLMVVALAWRFGEEAWHGVVMALTVMPPAIAGLWLGLRLGRRMDKRRFRRVTYGLLVLVAVAAIGSPWLAALFRYL